MPPTATAPPATLEDLLRAVRHVDVAIRGAYLELDELASFVVRAAGDVPETVTKALRTVTDRLAELDRDRARLVESVTATLAHPTLPETERPARDRRDPEA